MKNKKITVIGINFSPEDTAIGLYSTQICLFLQQRNYEVTVLTGFPYYPQWKIKEEYRSKSRYVEEEFRGIRILRYKQYVPENPTFFKRIAHLVDFTIGSFFNLRKIKRTDIILCIVPFTSTILLGLLLKKRTNAKLWTHVQDFEFDAAFQTGITLNDNNLKKIIFRLLFRIERWLFSKVDVASSISQTMLERLKTKTGDKVDIEYWPNWIELERDHASKGEIHKHFTSNKFKILYSGNIGNKQDWDFFLTFAKSLDKDKYELIVVGNGSKKKWLLKNTIYLDHVKHYEPVPYNELSLMLCSADLHILFQKRDVIDTVMPSKLLGMMASGVPSIIVGNEQSEVNKVIENSKGGYYFSDIIPEDLEVIIKKLAIKPNERLKIGEKARNYILENYSKNLILERIYQKIDGLE